MKPATSVRLLVSATTAFALAGASLASDNPAKPKPPTHVAGKTVIKAKAQLDAVAESMEMESIKLAPKSWADLTLVEAVPHGARVRKGDPLVRLDLDKLRDQIEDLEAEKEPASIALQLATTEFENLQQTTPHKLDAAKRAQRISDEDYTHFESIGRSMREKSARFNLKSAQHRLDSANEELKQLQKMYKADELTEETEEIILKRQQFTVQGAELGLESSRINSERDLKVMLPREHENLKNARRDQEIALALAEQTLPKTLAKKGHDLEKLKRDQKKADRKLTDLKQDLDSLSVRSPQDGLVYYGACENGKWTTGAVIAKKLVPGGKLQANEVLLTVVNPEKLQLKAIIPEADLGNLETGLKGEASPVSAPNRKFEATIKKIGDVPLPTGGFEATLAIDGRDLRLMPGMNCKISFTGVEKHLAVAVPKEAVITEGAQKVVYVAKDDGAHDKRVVKTGDSDDKMIEITEGVSAGESVLLKKPE